MTSDGGKIPQWFRLPSITEALAIAGVIWGAASLAANLRSSQVVLQATVEAQTELTRTVHALVTRVEVQEARLRALEEQKRR